MDKRARRNPLLHAGLAPLFSETPRKIKNQARKIRQKIAEQLDLQERQVFKTAPSLSLTPRQIEPQKKL